MRTQAISNQLEQITNAVDFSLESSALTERWRSTQAGIETVEPVLRYMEAHPEVDFGAPGPLVHFVEQFFGMGYEERLVESVKRNPTPHTVWMLNRVINGPNIADVKRTYIELMRQVAHNPSSGQESMQLAERFLSRIP